MTIFRQVPSYEVPLSDTKGNTGMAFYQWLQNTDTGVPPSTELQITVAGSPFVYQAPKKGYVFVIGGTVTLIQFSRTPGVWYPTGQVMGQFIVNANDRIQVTFTAPPQMVFVPS